MDGRTVECTTLIRDDYLQDDRNIGNFFFFGGGGSIESVLDDAYNRRHKFTSHQTNETMMQI